MPVTVMSAIHIESHHGWASSRAHGQTDTLRLGRVSFTDLWQPSISAYSSAFTCAADRRILRTIDRRVRAYCSYTQPVPRYTLVQH